MVKFKNWKTGIRKFGKLEKHSSKNWNIRKIGSCANEWTKAIGNPNKMDHAISHDSGRVFWRFFGNFVK